MSNEWRKEVTLVVLPHKQCRQWRGGTRVGLCFCEEVLNFSWGYQVWKLSKKNGVFSLLRASVGCIHYVPPHWRNFNTIDTRLSSLSNLLLLCYQFHTSLSTTDGRRGIKFSVKPWICCSSNANRLFLNSVFIFCVTCDAYLSIGVCTCVNTHTYIVCQCMYV